MGMGTRAFPRCRLFAFWQKIEALARVIFVDVLIVAVAIWQNCPPCQYSSKRL
jgi:hypothetical protein